MSTSVPAGTSVKLVLLRCSGVAALLQAFALAVLGIVESRDADLSPDFYVPYSAYLAIGRGDWNPFVSIKGWSYLQDHASLLSWPLMAPALLFSSPAVLKLEQAAAFAASTWIACRWSIELLEERGLSGRAFALCGTCVIFTTAAMPWTYWAAAFDWHPTVFAGTFVLAAARFLYRREYRAAWLAAAGAIASTEVAAPVVAGLGFGLLCARPSAWRQGAALIAAPLVWLSAIDAAIHPVGSTLDALYGYLAPARAPGTMHATDVALAILRSPHLAIAAIVRAAPQAYASLAPSGFLAIAAPFTFGPTLVVLLENLLAGNSQNLFNAPGFQYVAAYPLLVPGFVQALSAAKRLVGKPVLTVACVALALDAAGWAVVWLPLLPGRWLAVSAPAGRALQELRARIPATDEIVTGNGSAGLFAANRRLALAVPGASYPAHGEPVDVVIAPFDGIQSYESSEALGIVQALLRDPAASLASSSANVWAFTLRPEPGAATFALAKGDSPLQGGLLQTQVGSRDFSAGPRQSSVFVDGGNERPGYLAYGIYWRRPPADYRLTLRLSCATGCVVEVRDATADAALSSRVVDHADERDERFDVAFTDRRSDRGPAGWGPFFVPPVDVRPNARIEMRVYVGMHAVARISQVAIDPLPHDPGSENVSLPDAAFVRNRTKTAGTFGPDAIRARSPRVRSKPS